MVFRRTRDMSESTSDEETADMDFTPNNVRAKTTKKPTRVPHCFTKNALMARENRLKKKMYIANLEAEVAHLKSDNKKLSDQLACQSKSINECQKQVNYLQSVIVNSEDIRKLVRAINVNTGLEVECPLPTSLSSNVELAVKKTVNKQDSSKSTRKASEKKQSHKHPWIESDSSYENCLTPESSYSYYSSPGFDELENEGLLLDMDLNNIEMGGDELLNYIDDKVLDSEVMVSERNNTIKSENASDSNDVGVCLHVSKHKVSLEFCPTCNDNAKNCKTLEKA